MSYLIHLLLFVLSFSAIASENAAGLDSGNIVFNKTEGIKLLNEELYISPKKIKVNYQFENTTDNDIKIMVGFPIPTIELPMDDIEEYNFDTSSIDPLHFKTWVNGETLSIESHRTLKEDYQLTITYNWEQVFPAHKITYIQHEYEPAPTIGIGVYNDAYYEKYHDSDIKEFCMDSSFIKSIKKQHKGDYSLSGQIVNYILTTAYNWHDTIGNFHLIIDKLDAKSFVSLCNNDIHKINATQFEFTQTNFKPKADLHILFLERQTKQLK